MIKAHHGKVKLEGETIDILAEFGSIAEALRLNNIPIPLIRTSIDYWLNKEKK